MAQGFKPLGGGRFRNVKSGSPRKGKVFRKVDGAHVYKIGGRTVSIKGAPKSKAPAKPKTPAKPKPAPFDLAAPLTRQTFKAELKAATGLKFGPQERQLDAERRVSDQQIANTGSWYDDYLAAAERARQSGQQGFQQAAGNIRSATGAATAQSNAQNAQLSQQAQEAAAKLGATANPELDAIAARAVQSRQATGLAQAGLVDSLGASNNAYMADRGRIGAGAKLSALQQEAGNRRKIESAARDVATEKGQFRAEFRTQAREKERTYGLERAAFGLDTLKAKLDAKDDAASRRLARVKLREDRMRDRRDFAAGRDDEAFDRADTLADNQRADRGGGGASSLTPSQRRGYQADLGQAYSLAQAYMKNGRLKKGVSPGSVVAGLVGKKGYPRDLAKAAVQRAVNGGVDPALARAIKRKYGVNVKTRKPSKKVKTIAGVPIIGGKPTP